MLNPIRNSRELDEHMTFACARRWNLLPEGFHCWRPHLPSSHPWRCGSFLTSTCTPLAFQSVWAYPNNIVSCYNHFLLMFSNDQYPLDPLLLQRGTPAATLHALTQPRCRTPHSYRTHPYCHFGATPHSCYAVPNREKTLASYLIVYRMRFARFGTS